MYNLRDDVIFRSNSIDKEEIIIVLSGSLEIQIYGKTHIERFELNSPNVGLYIGPGISSAMLNFSTNTTVLFISSNKNSIKEFKTKYGEIKLNSHSWKQM